jgi:glycosyltransferase involved in cell wall biosynthesis
MDSFRAEMHADFRPSRSDDRDTDFYAFPRDGDGAAPVARGARRRMRVGFVAEHFAPPVRDGSTCVYKMWVDLLSRVADVYPIFFASDWRTVTAETTTYLERTCPAHLILPGRSRSQALKLLRALARRFSGTLFAPPWIEEFGRRRVQQRIASFLDRHDIDVFVFSKLHSIPLFGHRNLRRLRAPVFLDLHDDFVRRDELERAVLKRVLREFPGLSSYPPFANAARRNRVSRLVPSRARQQEASMVRLVDCVLSSSREEFEHYRALLAGGPGCEYLPWPVAPANGSPSLPGSPAFDAGFVATANAFNVEAAVYFCRTILPRVRERLPDFRFLIAGGVTAALSTLAPAWPGVSFASFTPDIRDIYEQLGVSVVPLLAGTGVSIKTLEALSWGRPVVATPTGARGIDRAKYPLLTIANEPDEFARALVFAVMRREAIGKTAAPGPSQDALEREFLGRFLALCEQYAPRDGKRLPQLRSALDELAARDDPTAATGRVRAIRGTIA